MKYADQTIQPFGSSSISHSRNESEAIMITINYDVDIVECLVKLEVVVPDNTRSLTKPLLLVAQQGSQLSSYFSHITYETLTGEGYEVLNETGINRMKDGLTMHYSIPTTSELFTVDGSLHITVLSGFHQPFTLFETLAHFNIQPFQSSTQKQPTSWVQLDAPIILPTRLRRVRRDFVAVHQPFRYSPEDFLLLDFDPDGDELVFLPKKYGEPLEMEVSFDT
jgi:hypothetical protein